jgi:hypothetical protein
MRSIVPYYPHRDPEKTPARGHNHGTPSLPITHGLTVVAPISGAIRTTGNSLRAPEVQLRPDLREFHDWPYYKGIGRAELQGRIQTLIARRATKSL